MQTLFIQTGCSWLANRLILFPSRHPVSTTATRETVRASGELDGQEIELFYQEFGDAGGSPDLYLLSLTGNAGRAEFMPEQSAMLLQDWLETKGGPKRVGVLALQYPGYGSNQGPANLSGLAQAGLDALDHLRQRAAGKAIYIHGLSFGSTVALHVARLRGLEQVQGLILEKPPNIRSMIVWRYGWWNLWLIAGPVALSLPESVVSDANAKETTGIPAVFILAEYDSIVPRAYALEVFDAYAGPRQLVESETHHNGPVTASNTPDLPAALDWLFNESRPGE